MPSAQVPAVSEFLRAEWNPPQHSLSLSAQYLPCLTMGADKVPQQSRSSSLYNIYIQVEFVHLHPYRSDPNKTNLLICKSPQQVHGSCSVISPLSD